MNEEGCMVSAAPFDPLMCRDFARLTSIRLRTANLVCWKLAPEMDDLIEVAGWPDREGLR